MFASDAGLYAAGRAACLEQFLEEIPPVATGGISGAHYLHLDGPRPRPVELAEEHALPPAEDDVAVIDQERHARPDERRLDVAVAVALAVAEPRLLVRDGTVVPEQQVVDDVGVGVLVDGDRGR